MMKITLDWPATLDELRAKLAKFLQDNPAAAASAFVAIGLEKYKTGAQGRAPTTVRVGIGNPSDDAVRKAGTVAKLTLDRVHEYADMVARIHLDFTTPKIKP